MHSAVETYQNTNIYLSASLHLEHVGGTMYRVEEGEYFAAVDSEDWFTENPIQYLVAAKDLSAVKTAIDREREGKG